MGGWPLAMPSASVDKLFKWIEEAESKADSAEARSRVAMMRVAMNAWQIARLSHQLAMAEDAAPAAAVSAA